MNRPYFILIGCICMTYILTFFFLLRKLIIVVVTLRAYLRNIVFGVFGAFLVNDESTS